MPVFVIDTNVVIGALLREGGSARRVLRACVSGAYTPLVGAALLAEYEDVMGRTSLAQAHNLSVNRLMDELATVALANHDAYVRFQTRAARCSC